MKLAVLLLTGAVLVGNAAQAHMSGPHEPLILALQRAESVVVVRANSETRRTSEGGETSVTRLDVWDGPETPRRFVLAQDGAHIHRLRRGQTYLVPVKRSVSGRVLVDFLSESPVRVDRAQQDDGRLRTLIRRLRRGSASRLGAIDVVEALRSGAPIMERLAAERISLAASRVDPVDAQVREAWVGALAARARDASLDPVTRSEALQLSAGLDGDATLLAVGEAALAWSPPALAQQVITLAERTGSANAIRALTRCADGLVPGVTQSARARCQRATDRGPTRPSAP